MAIRIFSEAIPRISYHLASRSNIWGQAGRHAHSTSAKVEGAAKERFKEIPDLTFEEFKRLKVESLEEYKKSPLVQELYKDYMENTEKISQAYEDYCSVLFNHYKLAKRGGNPATAW